VTERDLVIQFPRASIELASQQIPELCEILPLLERSRHGIEFFDMFPKALAHWHNVKDAHGLARFGAFCAFLRML
jgi:hypothetical protein